MPLAEPPAAAGALSSFPAVPLAGATLHRVWRHDLGDGSVRADPWHFATTPTDPQEGGRFDLPAAVGGSCYLASEPIASLLEALQSHLAVIPADELRVRRRVEIQPPDDAPDAADATNEAATGFGVTAGLWADPNRAATQAWAAAFRRDGWWALRTGVNHDVTGTGRAITLFDLPGAHPPTQGGWSCSDPVPLDTDTTLHAELARRGCSVVGPANLPAATDP